MKTLKLITFFVSLSFFTSIYSTANAANDCSQYNVLSHKWNMCKMGTLATDEEKAEKKKKKKKMKKAKAEKKPKKKSTLVDLLKKKGLNTQ